VLFNIYKICKRCQLFFVNLFTEWFNDRKEKVRLLYSKVNIFYKNFIDYAIKLNEIRRKKKKYSLSYLKYLIVMKLFIIPKLIVQIYIEDVFDDLNYLKEWSPLYINFFSFKKHIMSLEKKKKLFKVTRRRLLSISGKIINYNRELFNIVFSYFVYESVYFIVLINLTLILIFIYCYEHFDDEVYY